MGTNPNRRVLDELLKIRSFKELEEYVGPLSQEEQELLERVKQMPDEPTDEERDALGPYLTDEFIQNLVDKTIADVRKQQSEG